MSTHEPDKLLQLWQRHEIDTEMAIGHILQNLVSHHQAIAGLNLSVVSLKNELENPAQSGKQPVPAKILKKRKM